MQNLIKISSKKEFQDFLKRSTYAVVHFGAEWCDPCSHMNAIMETLAKEHSAEKVKFLYVDCERLEDLTEEYGVTSVPTFMVVRDQVVVKTIEGADVEQLTQAVSTYCVRDDFDGEDVHKSGSKGNATVMKATGGRDSLVTATKENNSKTNETEEELRKRLIHLTTVQPVVLFMKGNRESPQCGFSRKSSEALTKCEIKYGTFDILSDDAVRQGLKAYSDWPTYPQLYLNGELAGGNDIILEMAADGTLKRECENAIKKWNEEKQEKINKRIEKLLDDSKPVLLFMKGTPDEPKCGFSSKVVAALNKISGLASYDTFDILNDEDIRAGMKIYSDWPTFPQLYYKKELLGGCDIVLEMSETGELNELLSASAQ